MGEQLTKKQYSEIWQEFRDNMNHGTPVDQNETPDQKKARIARLEAKGNDEAWFKYYFPIDGDMEPARFHKVATRRVMNNPEWYEVRNWSRELAKSTRSMMEDLKLLLTKVKRYKLLVSATQTAAYDLFMPYMIALESNNRIINDYGVQERIGSWKVGNITTKTGFSIKAIGAGDKPRGTKKNAIRPDIIEFDDYDTDERCRNEILVDDDWDFANKAVIGTRSISKPTLIRWNGNIIAENCCIARAAEFANHQETINIRDKDGKSTWPQKNTEEFIDRTLSIIPFSAQQSEYYNNPFTIGKIFKDITWGEVPSLSKFPYLVGYADPATSNKDKDNGMGKNSYKSLVLVGCIDLKYYVIKCFLDQCTNAKFVDWFYIMEKWVEAQCGRNAHKPQLFSYIENNTLQEPFFDQVFKELFFQKSREHGRMISIIPDGTKKPNKFVRIEGTLEPINRLGFLVFNKKEQDDEHMKRLVDQLKSVSPNAKIIDGPDALQGAVAMTNMRRAYTGGIELFEKAASKMKF